MPKEDKSLVPAELEAAFGDAALALLDQFDIDIEDVDAPDVEIVFPVGFADLCDIHDAVMVSNVALNITGHTGPLMLLKVPEFRESDKYAPQGYRGFWVFLVARPEPISGGFVKCLVTYSAHAEVQDDLEDFLQSLRPGNLFTVGEFPTSSGYRVYRQIPVQAPRRA